MICFEGQLHFGALVACIACFDVSFAFINARADFNFHELKSGHACLVKSVTWGASFETKKLGFPHSYCSMKCGHACVLPIPLRKVASPLNHGQQELLLRVWLACFNATSECAHCMYHYPEPMSQLQLCKAS